MSATRQQPGGDSSAVVENPEITNQAVQEKPEDDYQFDQRVNREGSDNNRAENGNADAIKSPRYSSPRGGSVERRSERMSRSPALRKDSGNFVEGEGEDRRSRRRRGGSRSPSPAGSRGRRSRSPAGSRDGDRRRGEKTNDGPFTQVFVTGYSKTSRKEDLEHHFSRNGAAIQDVVMKSRFAFIEFKRPEDAAVAVRELDRSEFEGRQLTVQQSYPDGSSKRRRRTTGPQDADECWTCGKRGHWANDCERRGGAGGGGGRRRRSGSRDRRSRSPPRYQSRRRSRSRSGEGRSRELREGRCFLCLEKGHIKRDCPDLRGGRRMGGGRDRDRDHGRSYHHRRSHSRSRSPRDNYRRGGGDHHDMDARRMSPPRRHQDSRSPPRERNFREGGDRERSRE